MTTNYKLVDGTIVRCNNPIENNETKTITANNCLINVGGECSTTTVTMPSHKVAGAYGSTLHPERKTEHTQLDFKRADRVTFRVSDIAYVWVD